MILIKGGVIYTPECFGKADLIIAGDRVVSLREKSTQINNNDLFDKIYDVSGSIIVPGFVDGHVHLIGGGGEGGFTTRTTGAEEGDFSKAGTTTVIGLLGTDGITRDLTSLLAKVRAFNERGLRSFMLSGSYGYPVKTITGNIEKDIVLIPEILGAGEIAICDHRGSGINGDELKRLALEVRRGSMLAGKKGTVVCHMGGSPDGMKPLFEAVESGELPSSVLLPTHVSRNDNLLDQAIHWVEKTGGFIDFTAGEKSIHYLKDIVKKDHLLNNITVSTDGCGSLPVFDKDGNLEGIKSAPVDTLMRTFRMLVKAGISIENTLKLLSCNPAKIFGLLEEGVGQIKVNGLASFVIMSGDSMEITHVFGSGRLLYKAVGHGPV
ncbi:MAG: beta-aspartyl-peptidase [Thermotogota bacterium]|nr:beta-aspartyl-peptidase [Thermotogota bacterium]